MGLPALSILKSSHADKSSDFYATVAHFPLRQISGLRRRGGAKVVGDLLAGEIIFPTTAQQWASCCLIRGRVGSVHGTLCVGKVSA